MLARRWGLELLEPAHATYSTVWFASRGDEQLVLKIGDAAARERESAALQLYGQGGAPVCRLREVDSDALVVERVLPGDDVRPLAATDDDAATAVIGQLIESLHGAVRDAAQPAGLPPLATILAAFDRVPDHGPAPLPPDLVETARGLAVELSAPAEHDTVVHGDLHHKNVLRSGWDPQDCRWLAIDPHGWWGDPAFDCAPMLLDLHDSTALHGLTDAEVRRRTGRRIAILAERTGLEHGRIAGWAIAGALISELWCWQDHRLVQYWPQRLARVLAER